MNTLVLAQQNRMNGASSLELNLMRTKHKRIKLPKVISEYPEDVNMISFDRFKKWEWYWGFQYDWIKNRHVQEALSYPNLHLVDPNIDWEDDVFLSDDTSVRDSLKHPIRVAALIRLIGDGGGVVPITIDTFTRHMCRSCIPNGHHRIRMLQYLKYTHFPANCNGEVEMIDQLVDPEVDRLIEFMDLQGGTNLGAVNKNGEGI